MDDPILKAGARARYMTFNQIFRSWATPPFVPFFSKSCFKILETSLRLHLLMKLRTKTDLVFKEIFRTWSGE